MKNKLKFKSILSRFFFMNLTILIVIVIVQLFAQAFFFEKYYISKKEKSIKEEVSRFSDFLEKNSWRNPENLQGILEYIIEISNKKNIDISIRKNDMTSLVEIDNYMNKNYLKLRDEKTNKDYKVIVGDFLSGVELKADDYIRVEGDEDKYGYIIPKKIILNNDDIFINGMNVALIQPNNITDTEKYSKLEGSKEIAISGKIDEVNLKKNDLIVLKNIVANLPHKIKENIKDKSEYTTLESVGEQNNKFLISSKNIGDYCIVGINQLSEVNDFTDGVESFYIAIFIISLPIIGVLSFIYSRFIAKPLIEMSSLANEIANLNFGEKYNVKSQDEIGALGNALNNIGENLESSLNQLNEKINIQKIQEEQKKELIDNISHELKTPITIIQGSIQGYKKGIYSKEVLDDILEESEKMNILLIEMLEISKLEKPSFTVDKEIFDFNLSLLKEIDGLELLFKENRINLELDIEECLEGEELVIEGDEEKINMVIRNILTNAIKYTPQGEAVIIRLREEEEGTYYFSVENFGVSLKKEEIENIWEPFYRGEKSRNKKYGGSGLGLYFVKKVLEAHNYRYGVINEDNSVTFYFYLNH